MSGSNSSQLREQAEHVLRGQSIEIGELSDTEIKQVIHELQVHQIELELQNAQLQQIQQDLEASRDLYTHLYDFAPVGYLTLDTNSQILGANLTSLRILGIKTRSELQNTPFTDFVDPNHQDTFFRFWRRVFKTRVSQQCELELLRHGSEQFYAQLEGVVVEKEENGKRHGRLIISDIHRRKKAEEAVYRTQKLESLGVMAGGIAHDFNNLLSAVLMQQDLARLKLNPDHVTQSHLRKAGQAARQAVELTNQLLAYVGQAEYQVKALNLNDFVVDSLVLLEASIPHHVSLVPHLAPKLSAIEADMRQMQQVLINLLLNAAEAYDDQPGVVWIETEAVNLTEAEVGEFLHAYNISPGRYVVLTVRDQGKGMTPETAARAFEPFFTTKFTGRGLGLAAIQGIVRQHQGAISLESVWKQGTAVSVYFPALPPSQDPDLRLHDDGLEADTATVLLIDDETVLREGIEELLTINGIQVFSTGNGPDGLDIFQKHMEQITAVVLDLTMPIMSGEEVLAELRRIKPTVPVIVTTGYGEAEALRRLQGMDPYYFLAKPMDIEDLMRTVREIQSK